MEAEIRYYPDDAIKAALMLCVLDGQDIDSPAFLAATETIAGLFDLTGIIIECRLGS